MHKYFLSLTQIFWNYCITENHKNHQDFMVIFEIFNIILQNLLIFSHKSILVSFHLSHKSSKIKFQDIKIQIPNLWMFGNELRNQAVEWEGALSRLVLPSPRVQVREAFFHVGVDLAGPLKVKMSFSRGHKSCKGYRRFYLLLHKSNTSGSSYKLWYRSFHGCLQEIYL